MTEKKPFDIDADDSAAAKDTSKPVLSKNLAGDVKLYDTPPRVAAMLMAIVANNMQVKLSELRFLSIREIKENE